MGAEKVKLTWRTAGALVVVFVLGCAVIWALVTYGGLQASILWTGFIGVLVWAIQSNTEQKREYARLLADRKRDHYQELLEFYNNVINLARQEKGRELGSDDISEL